MFPIFVPFNNYCLPLTNRIITSERGWLEIKMYAIHLCLNINSLIWAASVLDSGCHGDRSLILISHTPQTFTHTAKGGEHNALLTLYLLLTGKVCVWSILSVFEGGGHKLLSAAWRGSGRPLDQSLIMVPVRAGMKWICYECHKCIYTFRWRTPADMVSSVPLLFNTREGERFD